VIVIIDMRINNKVKTVYDLTMLALLVVVYSVSATGILIHEILGLIIFVFFIIHLLYNYKWIKNVTKRIFDNSLNEKTKFMYLIDFLLLLMFIIVGMSGIMISKYIFKIGIKYFWGYIHIVSSALTVVLIGFHIELHFKTVNNAIKNKISNYKIVYIFLLILVFSIGTYGILQKNNRNESKTETISVLNHFEDVFKINNSVKKEHENKIEHGYKEKDKGNLIEEYIKDEFKIDSVIKISSGYLMTIILFSIIINIIKNITRKK
jgi:hypothetical protein